MSGGARRVVVTGAAGFIGFHVARALLRDGCDVLGIDNLNPYYDPALKRARLAQLAPHGAFTLEVADIADHDRIGALFERFGPSHVVHLAAQAGVRHSLDNPRAYVASNVAGFLSVLEACRHCAVEHLLYASSSSVYGAAAALPVSEDDRADSPVSLYAATKRANELMAHSYAHLFGIAATGLRLFTVYGPWGRPDMAYYIFARAILAGQPIEIFAPDAISRDFTYIDDVVETVRRLLDRPLPAEATPARHRVFNVGSHVPVGLEQLAAIIGRAVGRPATIGRGPTRPGDVTATYADTARLRYAIGFVPETPIETGIEAFVGWLRAYDAGERGVP